MSETPWREASPAAEYDALQIAADDDRVRALDALRESEERYRELFENANDMVYTQDLSGRITSVNRATERLSGYSRAELLTLTIDQLVESSSRPVMRAMLDRKLSGEERTIYEVEMRAKDGRLGAARSQRAPDPPRRHPGRRPGHRPRHHRAQARRGAAPPE